MNKKASSIIAGVATLASIGLTIYLIIALINIDNSIDQGIQKQPLFTVPALFGHFMFWLFIPYLLFILACMIPAIIAVIQNIRYAGIKNIDPKKAKNIRTISAVSIVFFAIATIIFPPLAVGAPLLWTYPAAFIIYLIFILLTIQQPKQLAATQSTPAAQTASSNSQSASTEQTTTDNNQTQPKDAQNQS
jgi:hypothetical protein